MDTPLDLYRVSRAELGTGLARFPSAAHVASWAGMCPGTTSVPGALWPMHRGGRAREGSKWLWRSLIEAACSEVRTKQAGRTALAGHYRRLVAPPGRQAEMYKWGDLTREAHRAEREQLEAELGSSAWQRSRPKYLCRPRAS